IGDEGKDWAYRLVGQSEWSAYFPDCRGTSQSPIDVVTTQTKYDPSLIPLTPLGYSQHGNKPFTLYNNGHTAVIELPEWMGLGGLPWLFTAVQMHLHWGSGGPSHGGSEHTINGLSADAELHVVHYNSELYPNMSAAMTQRDGLAVLGILIVETNLAFNSILNYLSRIRHADQKVPIPAFDIQSLLPKDLGRYYRYNGSLTTPPCYQSVIWTVFHERVQISKAQLLKMETILYSSKADNPDRMLLQDNYRATQPLNHRVVFASFSAGEVTAIVIGVMCGCVEIRRHCAVVICSLFCFYSTRGCSRHWPPVCCCSGLTGQCADTMGDVTVEKSSLFSSSISYLLADFLDSSTVKQSW
uniref:carbonic anhydrase n=1 Tax=Seriola dumerili TaxID=41447 RepID=A0A3B4TU31_SERDU